MLPVYHDPWFTIRFTDNRIIPRFHLEGIEAGRRLSVFRIDPGTGERLGLLATATVGEGGWVDLDNSNKRLASFIFHFCLFFFLAFLTFSAFMTPATHSFWLYSSMVEPCLTKSV